MINRRLVFWGMCLAGLVVVGGAWLGRSFGVHYDENNYLAWSLTKPYGDADVLAKSFVFYFLNFAVNSGIGPFLGSWRPVALYLVYGTMNVVCLAWLATSFNAPTAKALAFFGIALVSPLFLFNTVQVMMETPMLGLVALVFASLLRQQHDDRAWLRWLAGAAAFLTVAIKTTGVFPILILAVVFGYGQWTRMVPPLAGITAALVLLQLQTVVLHTPSGNYGSLAEDLNVPRILTRLGDTGEYLKLWIFFVSPPLLLGALYGLRRGASLDHHKKYWLMAGLSLLAVFVIQIHSLLSFARYTYPSVWLGFICMAWLALNAVSMRWVLPLVLLVAIPSVDMDLGTDSRLSLWPRLVSDEAYASGYQVLPGPRLFQWWVFADNEARIAPCFYVPSDPSDASIRQFMTHMTRNPRFFNADSRQEFNACQGAHGVLERRLSTTPHERCAASCEPSDYSSITCAVQPHRYPVNLDSALLNLTCLP